MTENTVPVISQNNPPVVVYPLGYVAKSWDDYEPEPVKLCRLEDPTCEACQ
jgi:hypothetical protein